MTNPDVKTLVSHYRQSIDNIDAALINILAERFRCTERVGHLKAQYGLPARDEAREHAQLERVRGIAAGAQLSPDLAQEFLGFLLREMVKNHTAIALAQAGGEKAAS
ncbi:chorismate mutase (plasmid) [Aliirhizobium terrae]|uniref:chorismate mutase n=1 Tax=Terrirhizobium terrae TaxID=2926709 RepID=UPI0025762D0E|nr:chorismate mutase [Rhizobium sp. CC-CFT758]WJH37894.1 chorismate mutase [Rhizobium sp. CC-CFT758]